MGSGSGWILCARPGRQLGHRAPSLLRPGPWHPPAPSPSVLGGTGCAVQSGSLSGLLPAGSCCVLSASALADLRGPRGVRWPRLLTPRSAPGRASQAPLSSGFLRRPSSVSRDCQACFLELSPALPATAGVMPTGLGVRHRFPCPSPLVSHQELSGGQRLLRKAGPGPLRYGGARLGTRKLHGGGSPGMR